MQRYFDTGCFQAPPANRFGNAGRNILVGPTNQSVDAALSRSFNLEHLRIEFRAEAYSIFNAQNWNNPDTSFVSPTFGQILTKNNPRRFQFGLRVEF
jgi:hypothetical protein